MSSVVRVEKNKNYTTMSNYHLRDKRLSLKAKGLMSFMLSLPDEWDYSVAGLEACLKDGKYAIRSALKELEDCGYLCREKQLRTDDGKFGKADYILHEKPSLENKTTGKWTSGNRTQINTKRTSTDKLNTKDKAAAAATSSSTENPAMEEDDETAKVFTLFQNNIHPISGEIEKDTLDDLIKDYGPKWVEEAIKEAALNNGRSVKYISVILERWSRDGFKAERRKTNGTNERNHARRAVTVPANGWADAERRAEARDGWPED